MESEATILLAVLATTICLIVLTRLASCLVRLRSIEKLCFACPVFWCLYPVLGFLRLGLSERSFCCTHCGLVGLEVMHLAAMCMPVVGLAESFYYLYVPPTLSLCCFIAFVQICKE
eukprot:2739660-Amphidinium_carterae.1